VIHLPALGAAIVVGGPEILAQSVVLALRN
jgi:hypothetical protein